MFPKRAPTEEEKAKEMMEGLFEDADGEEEKEDDVEARNGSSSMAEGMVTVRFFNVEFFFRKKAADNFSCIEEFFKLKYVVLQLA